MSTKKNKLLESAQKNIQKGQYGRAIKEYEEIISLDPGDIRHRQKLAELLTKANRNDEAVKEYAALAKHYIDAVYYLKAIAVYKQIQKLEPANPEVSLTLASLNEKQGLIGNAIAEYNSALHIYEANSENRKALKVLESLLALDPKNAAIRLRIAEKYFTMGDEGKALEGFTDLALDLRDNGDENGFTHVANRLVSLFPEQANKILSPAETTPEIERVVPEPVPQPEPAVPLPTAPPSDGKQETPLPIEPPVPSLNEQVEIEEPYEILDELMEIVEEAPPADHEWEEEIDLGSVEIQAVAGQTVETVPMQLEELAITPDMEMEELGLELEISDLNLEIEAELDIEPDFELEAEPEREIETELEIEVEPELEIESGLELEVEPELEIESELDLEVEEELEIESGVEFETEQELEFEIESGLELEAEPVPAGEGVSTEEAAELTIQTQEPPTDTFDLAGEIALFADELDFNLPQRDSSSELFTADTEMFKTSDLDREDAESHYSLGLAYKEMGLYDEAINEFIVASNSPARKIDCLLLQSQCHRDNGDLSRAETILTFLMEEPSISEDELLSVKYELAACHELSGEMDSARRLFTEIVTIRPGFSDAASRLKNL
ncbi:MAG TPA: tetratricopeptide repeat protein [Geobacteraceae bacterium]|nr:tetratricopeptide repeat protein [Geobacteraceae bacterium]